MKIFFDLDGTLIEVATRHHKVYSEIVIDMGGKPLDKDTYWKRKRAKESWPAILESSNLRPDLSKEFLNSFIAKIEDSKYLQLDKLLPGAKEVLQELSKKNDCYLVSLRRNPEILNQEVHNLGLDKYFQKVLTGHSESDGSDKKTELIDSELDSQEAIIIGDTEADVKTGKALGVTTVAVLSGIRDAKFIKSLGPDYTISSIRELISLPLFKSTKATVSVVMPTYTGGDNIIRALESVAAQKIKKYHVELTVVIDGPNEKLHELVNSRANLFKRANITFRVKMLKKNVGRFQAILTGARMSEGKWLVLIGDRMLWPADYLAVMARQGKELVIADTHEEGWQKSAISLTLHHLRRRLYKRKGAQHKPIYINRDNFEKSGKGSGGMWIDRELFLWACDQIKEPHQKHISDDTKLLKALVDTDHPIYWTNETHIIYCPRSGFWHQVKHIYQRGPRFINYYLQPGTRYFAPLILTILTTLAAITLLVMKPLLLLWGLIVLAGFTILAALYLAHQPADIPRLLWAIPLICLAFYIGLLKGLVIHYTHEKKLKIS